ncbi:MAG: cation transporter [Deltaproteobacteria bacterium]|nr:cation transporter [Deltaproteobacteria bacterium]
MAIWLVGGTLGYNVIEATVALWFGARADSIALFGFGLDSVIECAAATVLLWRLTKEAHGAAEEDIEAADRKVRRFIGLTFFALAAYVAVEAAWTLARGARPDESVAGIVLAVASLVVMPILAWAKLKVAAHLDSGALRSEAKETLACAYLSLALLLGLVANAAAGWWQADPIAALAMTPWLVKEGLEGVRGERD